MVRTQLRGSQFFIGTASPPISLAHWLRPMPRQRNITDPKQMASRCGLSEQIPASSEIWRVRCR
jgi:hypothetical protein